MSPSLLNVSDLKEILEKDNRRMPLKEDTTPHQKVPPSLDLNLEEEKHFGENMNTRLD